MPTQGHDSSDKRAATAARFDRAADIFEVGTTEGRVKIIRSHHDQALDMLLNAVAQYRNRLSLGITVEHALHCLDVAVDECVAAGIFEQDDS